MKKLIFVLSLMFALTACTGGQTTKVTEPAVDSTIVDTTGVDTVVVDTVTVDSLC